MRRKIDLANLVLATANALLIFYGLQVKWFDFRWETCPAYPEGWKNLVYEVPSLGSSPGFTIMLPEDQNYTIEQDKISELNMLNTQAYHAISSALHHCHNENNPSSCVSVDLVPDSILPALLMSFLDSSVTVLQESVDSYDAFVQSVRINCRESSIKVINGFMTDQNYFRGTSKLNDPSTENSQKGLELPYIHLSDIFFKQRLVDLVTIGRKGSMWVMNYLLHILEFRKLKISNIIVSWAECMDVTIINRFLALNYDLFFWSHDNGLMNNSTLFNSTHVAFNTSFPYISNARRVILISDGFDEYLKENSQSMTFFITKLKEI